MNAQAIVFESHAMRASLCDRLRGARAQSLARPFVVCAIAGQAVAMSVAGVERRSDPTVAILINALIPHRGIADAPAPLRRVLSIELCPAWIRTSAAAPRGMVPTRPFGVPVAAINARLRGMFESFAASIEARSPDAGDVAETLGRAILISFGASNVPTGSRAFDYRIRKAVNMVYDRPGRRVSVDDMVEMAELSRSRFFELFGECVGVSPQTLIDAQTLEVALDRLGHGTEAVGDVSRALGFRSSDVFSRFFRREIGVTPRDYRRSLFQTRGASDA